MHNSLLLILIGWIFCGVASVQPQELPVREDDLYVRLPSTAPRRMGVIVRDAYRGISSQLTSKLGLSLPKPAIIEVCASHDGMERLVGCTLPPWAVGVAIPRKMMIGVDGSQVGVVSNTLASIVRHETCHLFLGVWEEKYGRRLPLWFNEGMSEWCSGAIHFTYQEQILTSVAFDRVIPLAQLQDEFPADTEKAIQSYLQALSVVEFIELTYGEGSLRKVLDAYSTRTDFSAAIEHSLGVTFKVLEQKWRKYITPDEPWFWLWRFSNLFSLFTILAFLVIVAYLRQRYRNRQTLTRWEEAETGIPAPMSSGKTALEDDASDAPTPDPTLAKIVDLAAFRRRLKRRRKRQPPPREISQWQPVPPDDQDDENEPPPNPPK